MGGFDWSYQSFEDPQQSFEAGSLRQGGLFGERFRVESKLGAGGMGQVFRAVDTETGRSVALKVMTQATNPRGLDRFFREAELTARLDHPGILRIHGSGQTVEGLPFLVLELVENARPLDEALGEVGSREGLEALVQVARAVGHAHRHGIVHRDLKPNNILVGEDGRPRVCDFGLAWSGDVDGLTRSNELLGTPLYMAPEMVARHPDSAVEPAVDVWALGVMLYHHLTGALPFNPSTILELIALLEEGKVTPPRAVDPRVSEPLQAVCLRALEKVPEERLPDGDAFADALEVGMVGGITTEATARRWLYLAGAAFLIAMGLLLLAGSPEVDGVSDGSAPVASASPLPPEVASDRSERLAALVAEGQRGGPFDPGLSERFRAFSREAGPPLADRVELERLRYLVRRGRWAEALNELPPLEARPGSLGAEATLLRAVTVYTSRVEGTWVDDAAQACRRVWEGPPGDRPGLRLACGAWLELFDGSASVANLRAAEALGHEPKLLAAILADGIASGRQLKFDAALARIESARTLAPDHPTPILLRAISHSKVGEREEALQGIRALLKLLEPDPPWEIQRLEVVNLAGLPRWDAMEVLARRELATGRNRNHWRFVLGLGLFRQELSRWRGIEVLQDLLREAPALLREDARFVFARDGALASLLEELDEPPERLAAGLLYEEAMDAYRKQDLVGYQEKLEASLKRARLPVALFLMGENYAIGRGVPKDLARARALLEEGAALGSPGASFSLGVIYANGRGVPVDRQAAFRYYLTAADGGYTPAMVNLGTALEQGWDGEPRVDEAERWWRKAADEDDHHAMLNLGRICAEDGRLKEARRWWRRVLREAPAAELRAQAERLLGVLYRRYPELR